MFKLFVVCATCIMLSTIAAIPNKSNKRNSLSPSKFAQLISTHNPEGYTMVECSINDLIILIQTRPDWSPLGQKRFVELVNDRYYDGAALFRAIKNFLVQFGLASTKSMRDKWAGRDANILDDPPIDMKFTRGIMSFAGSGKDTRGTQIFFTLATYSEHLGKEAWEVPFGQVIYGDDALASINTQYDDSVSQQRIWRDGYDYLRKEFPNLSYIEYCRTINENEIMYYLKAAKKQQKQKQQQQQHVQQENNLLEEDKKHDLQQQLFDDSDNNNNGFGKISPLVFILQIIGGSACIGGIVFAMFKLLKKTPDKNN